MNIQPRNFRTQCLPKNTAYFLLWLQIIFSKKKKKKKYIFQSKTAAIDQRSVQRPHYLRQLLAYYRKKFDSPHARTAFENNALEPLGAPEAAAAAAALAQKTDLKRGLYSCCYTTLPFGTSRYGRSMQCRIASAHACIHIPRGDRWFRGRSAKTRPVLIRDALCGYICARGIGGARCLRARRGSRATRFVYYKRAYERGKQTRELFSIFYGPADAADPIF